MTAVLKPMARVTQTLGWVLLTAIIGLIILPLLLVTLLAAPIVRASNLAQNALRRRAFFSRVRREWHPRGIYMLWIDSDSPHWKQYCEEQIIPRVQKHAVILDWSKRLEWWRSRDLAVKIFKSYGDVILYRRKGRSGYHGREFCPMAVVFLESGAVEVLRFYSVIRESKKGHTEPLRALERRLGELVSAIEQSKAR